MKEDDSLMELHLNPSPDYQAAGIKAPEGRADLALYLLPATQKLPSQMDKPLVLICPGGAYAYCSDREAEPVAAKYLAAGFHAAVLRYHAPALFPTALLELAWSVKTIRRFADRWHIRKDAIFVCGFSAGGHLAASLGTLWDLPLLHTCFGEEPVWRPDAQILGYPVVTMGTFTHADSRTNLVGPHPDPELVNLLSLEKQVTPKTVPSFLWHTVADGSVPVENSLQYALALQQHHVRYEMHLFETGRHGLSVCEEITANSPDEIVPDNACWVDLSLRFLHRITGNTRN